MKKIICFLLIVFLCRIVSAQNKQPEFYVPMYFEDGIGNKDTVYAGFDINAEGDIIDGDFGEKIINDQPWKSDFEVRLGTFSGPFGNIPTMSKIDVQKNECTDTITGFTRTFNVLYLKAKYFPINWSWDSTKFKNDCTINSFYDRSPKSQLAAQIWLKNAQHFRKFGGQAILNKSYIESVKKNHSYDFIDPISGVDTINSICFYFLDKKRLAYEYANANDFYETKVNIFPNPVNNILTLKLGENIIFDYNTQLQIINTSGQTIQQEPINTSATQIETDVSALPSGLYFVQLRSPQGLLFTGKFVKLE